MKQNITREQIDELSYEAKEKLYLSLFPNMMEDKNRKIEGFRKVIDINPAYLTIGRMIEFLSENVKWFGLRGHYVDPNTLGSLPNGGTAWDIDGAINDEIEDETDLCDCLWKAVKKVLTN